MVYYFKNKTKTKTKNNWIMHKNQVLLVSLVVALQSECDPYQAPRSGCYCRFLRCILPIPSIREKIKKIFSHIQR